MANNNPSRDPEGEKFTGKSLILLGDSLVPVNDQTTNQSSSESDELSNEEQEEQIIHSSNESNYDNDSQDSSVLNGPNDESIFQLPDFLAYVNQEQNYPTIVNEETDNSRSVLLPNERKLTNLSVIEEGSFVSSQYESSTFVFKNNEEEKQEEQVSVIEEEEPIILNAIENTSVQEKQTLGETQGNTCCEWLRNLFIPQNQNQREQTRSNKNNGINSDINNTTKQKNRPKKDKSARL